VRAVAVAVTVVGTVTHRCVPPLSCPLQGVKCLGLLNENTAVALAYGMHRSAKGEFDGPSETVVMFVDMGDSSFTYVHV
jgi:hypothetical protein